MIYIIDYSAGNPESIKNMLKKIGVTSEISSDLEKIKDASRLILPGVGSFDFGMNALNMLGLAEVIRYKTLKEKVPFLGICLGAQLLGMKSEEGSLPGLGLIEMDIVRFNKAILPANYKIPNMGWNDVSFVKDSGVATGYIEKPRFYFVHSYHFEPMRKEDILATSTYGYEYVSAVSHENITGVQFHPEKSHKFGMQLLKNFVDL